jgi:hypothetical protein
VTRPVPRPWWERHLRRLAWDEQLLRQIQPEMAFVHGPDGAPFVRGKIVVVSDVGFANRVPAEIRFPTDYPRSEPLAYQTPKVFERIIDRHLYGDGGCCLWLPVASPWKRRDSFAFREFVLQLTVFFEKQLIVDAMPGSSFPGEQWAHGVDGYVAYIAANWRVTWRQARQILAAPPSRTLCPCGSGKAFGQCHEQEGRRFWRMTGPEAIRQIVNVLKKLESAATPLDGAFPVIHGARMTLDPA